MIDTASTEARTIDVTPPGPANSVPPALTSFKDYYFGTVFRPRDCFNALMGDARRLRYGIIALAINAQLYTLLYVFLSLGGGAPSSMKPWLAISADSYYEYDEFFLAPSMFICWILAAGLAQLFSRPASGKGSFEDMLSVLGFAISIPCLPALLVDLPQAFLGAFGLIDLRQVEARIGSPGLWHEIVMLLYSLSICWSAVLFCVGVRSAQRIARRTAIVVGLFAYLVYELVFVVFNR